MSRCPEDACTTTYIKLSTLEKYTEAGKHKFYPEKESLLDTAKSKHANTLLKEQGVADAELPKGWALKSSRKPVRFNETQKQFLTEKFQIGEETGNKEDRAKVCQELGLKTDMHYLKVFSKEECLTTQQIATFFSRLASKKRLSGWELNQKDIEEINDELEDPAHERQELDRLRRVAEQELQIIHPTTGSHHSTAVGRRGRTQHVKKGKKGESGEKGKESRKEGERKKRGGEKSELRRSRKSGLNAEDIERG